MRKRLFPYLIVMLLLLSCKEEPEITGLWKVTSVSVGEDEMTPNARWMRFNKDHTQESGNGWLQHSVGTWNLDRASGQLTVINENGLDDPYDPFTVDLSDDSMTWKRSEEGQQVTVLLERAAGLPLTYADQLMGLWKLENTTGSGKYFDASDDPQGMIFFRWDRRFVLQSDRGRVNGVYNVHGHKPEVELIPYGDGMNRDFWKIQFEKDAITLLLLNTDSTVSRTFRRVRKFPQD